MNSSTNPTSPSFLRVGEAATALFGRNTSGNRARIVRLCDHGELAAIRVGERGDRLVPSSEVDRLLADAEAARQAAVAARASA